MRFFVAKWKPSVEEIGYLIYCQDTKSNVFRIMQQDEAVQ